MRRRHQQKLPERKPSREDELHDEAVQQAARTLVEHFRRAYAGRLSRSIGSLQKHEIMAMTEDCISTWCRTRLAQAKAEQVPIAEHDQFILGS